MTDTNTDTCDSACSVGTLKCGSEGGCRVNSTFNQERCGEACFKFNQETGALSTAQYPLPYNTNQNCVLKLSAPEGYHVLVNIHEYELTRGSYLRFYEGHLTGNQNPIVTLNQEKNSTSVLAFSNRMLIHFLTYSSSGRGKGLNATVLFIKIHKCDYKGPCTLQCPHGFIPCNNHCMLKTTSTCPEPCLTFNTTTMILSSINFPGICVCKKAVIFAISLMNY